MDMPQRPAPSPAPSTETAAESARRDPLGAVAAALVEASATGSGDLIHVAEDERDAEELAELARAFAPGLAVLVFPPWDCLPYDRASPSAASMGARMATLLALAHGPDRPRLVLTSPEAMIQLTVPAPALKGVQHRIALDSPGEVEAVTTFAWLSGYRNQQ